MFYKGFHVFRLQYKVIIAVLLFVTLAWYACSYITNLIEERTIEALSWVVSQKTIVIDPGHGGYDSGAIGPGGTLEKDINLAVSKRLAEYLRNSGSSVVLTRTSDRDFLTPGPGTKKSRDLNARLDIVKESGGDLYINIQANSFGTRWQGAQTFYNTKNEENKKIAAFIQEELREVSNTNREIRENTENYMLKNINIPGVMVEVGFISNSQEEERLNDPAYQEELAQGIYTGIIRYFLEKGVG